MKWRQIMDYFPWRSKSAFNPHPAMSAEQAYQNEYEYLVGAISDAKQQVETKKQEIADLEEKLKEDSPDLSHVIYAHRKAEIEQTIDAKISLENSVMTLNADLERLERVRADREQRAEICRNLASVQERFDAKEAELKQIRSEIEERRSRLPRIGMELNDLMKELAAAKAATQSAPTNLKELSI